MKNIFLSLVIFVVMSLLHAQFTDWVVRFLKLRGGDYGMYSMLILIFSSVITAIGVITVIIFRKSYDSILRIAILFEVIYLLFLIISGNNPFKYFSEPTNKNLLMTMMYGNSIIIFLLMLLVHLLYSKIISSKNKKLP
jgi:hypothetical protein